MHQPDTALLSIHDVMPESRDAVSRIADRVLGAGALPCTLLVVPGRDWSTADIKWLHELDVAGFTLAGHGWRHETTPRRLYHRVHSALISRHVAEHLALDTDGIAHLIQRCHDWFGDYDLPAPSLYVPPAWAMGPIDRATLAALPFTQYETLTGIYDVPADRFAILPLAGFEADTAWRTAVLKSLNAFSRTAARLTNRTLRIAIHPRDFEYALARDLPALLQSRYEWRSYGTKSAMPWAA